MAKILIEDEVYTAGAGGAVITGIVNTNGAASLIQFRAEGAGTTLTFDYTAASGARTTETHHLPEGSHLTIPAGVWVSIDTTPYATGGIYKGE